MFEGVCLLPLIIRLWVASCAYVYAYGRLCTQVSLTSVMTLRPSEDDQPPAPTDPNNPQPADAAAASSNNKPTAVDRLLEVLLGKGPVPSVPSLPAKVKYDHTCLLTRRALCAQRCGLTVEKPFGFPLLTQHVGLDSSLVSKVQVRQAGMDAW